MTRRAGLLFALVLTSAACADRRPEADAIVVAMLNSPANLDSRVGADEASQKVPDLEGVRLSPIADFLILKDVHRSGAALTAGGAE